MGVILSIVFGILAGMLPKASGITAAMLLYTLILIVSGVISGPSLIYFGVVVLSIVACNIGLCISLLAPAYLRPVRSA